MTKKFPVDAPRQKVIKALPSLGFQVIREREHISMVMICTQADILRNEFLEAYKKA